MGCQHRDVPIHLHVEVNVVLQACFAGEALLNTHNAGHGGRILANLINARAHGHGIHELKGTIAEHSEGGDDYEEAHGESAVMVSGTEAFRLSK